MDRRADGASRGKNLSLHKSAAAATDTTAISKMSIASTTHRGSVVYISLDEPYF